MPSNPNLFYLSVTDYRNKTTSSLVAAESEDSVIEELLLEAMVSLDAYVGKGWHPFTSGQEFIFPRCLDVDKTGDAFIPRGVAIATRLIADAIIQKRQNGNQRPVSHEVASETNLGHSYTKKTQVIEPELGFSWWPEQAFGYLDEFKRVGGYLGLDESDEFPTS